MSDPAAALQRAIYTALTTDTGMVSAFNALAQNAGSPRIYDNVPADSDTNMAVFPYITIGEDQIIGQANSCHDMSEVWAKIEIWSRPTSRSKAEVKTLAGAVRAALDKAITVTGFNISAFRFHNAIYRREADGLTERAIVTQYYTLEPTA